MSRQSTPQIILASSSPYRQALLRRLGVYFDAISPKIDEKPLKNEQPDQLALRLALEKATKIADLYPNSLIIGSDQVALLGEQIVGKPGSHEKAVKQLKQASGQKMKFLTSVCLFNSGNRQHQLEIVPYTVYFRDLDDDTIEHYLKKEQPYNCAGAFKSESLGIALIEKMEGDDPTALIGLPLIRLCQMLAEEGIKLV